MCVILMDYLDASPNVTTLFSDAKNGCIFYFMQYVNIFGQGCKQIYVISDMSGYTYSVCVCVCVTRSQLHLCILVVHCVCKLPAGYQRGQSQFIMPVLKEPAITVD